MSTSPEGQVPGDRSPAAVENEIVSALSHWLASHLGNEELLARLRLIGTDGLGPVRAGAVEELVDELEQSEEGQRGELEMLVRETMEVVVLGG
jgi:hypothetical protein